MQASMNFSVGGFGFQGPIPLKNVSDFTWAVFKRIPLYEMTFLRLLSRLPSFDLRKEFLWTSISETNVPSYNLAYNVACNLAYAFEGP